MDRTAFPGPPYFHHCWEKLNKSSIGAIAHRFAPTNREQCPMLALTTFESYPLMGLPPVPVTSRPYSSTRPMAKISKPRSQQSLPTKHLAGCATFTLTPTTNPCCPYWQVLKSLEDLLLLWEMIDQGVWVDHVASLMLESAWHIICLTNNEHALYHELIHHGPQ